MENEKIYLYDNSSVCFRLTLDTIYESKVVKPDGVNYKSSMWAKPYTDDAGHTTTTVNSNPVVMLSFTVINQDYKDTKPFCLSMKYIPQLRQMFAQMAEMLSQEDLTVTVNNALTINDKYQNGVGFEKANKDWISLRPMVFENSTTMEVERRVALSTSKSNGFSAPLEFEDFYALNDMIQHMDVVGIIAIQSLTKFIDTRSALGNSKPQVAQKPQAAKPSFYNYGANNFGKLQSSRSVAPSYQQQPQVQTYQQQVQQQPQYTAPVESAQTVLAPRSASSVAKPKVTFDAIKDIPVEDMDIDDDDAINQFSLGK